MRARSVDSLHMVLKYAQLHTTAVSETGRRERGIDSQLLNAVLALVALA